eukprot:351135_1
MGAEQCVPVDNDIVSDSQNDEKEMEFVNNLDHEAKEEEKFINTFKSGYEPKAVLTGGSSGIGAAMAAKLLSLNWKVVLIARSVNKMKKITEKYKPDQFLIVECDLSKEKQVIDSCTKINKWTNGKINFLLNCAGICHSAGIEAETLFDHKNLMAVNFSAAFLFTKYLLPSLKKGAEKPINNRYGANIVNVSSCASISAYFPVTSYNISKAAIEAMSRCNALEFAPFNIRVNVLRIGWIDTPILNDYLAWNAPRINPLKRVGSTNDTTQLMLFLLDGSKSSYISGTDITLDGGFHMIDAFQKLETPPTGDSLASLQKDENKKK